MTITACSDLTTAWARTICGANCRGSLTDEQVQQYVTLGRITQAECDDILAFCNP
jgi:hypothetical protein